MCQWFGRSEEGQSGAHNDLNDGKGREETTESADTQLEKASSETIVPDSFPHLNITKRLQKGLVWNKSDGSQDD